MEDKVIQVDLVADFGFLKKPDINEDIYLTFNMLHKPALLGILGAIVGFRGYERLGDLPEYYTKLKDLEVAIKPMNFKKGDSEQFAGSFSKTNIKFNNSVGYASGEQGGNLIIQEQTLIKPCFQIHLRLNKDYPVTTKLSEYLQKGHSEFIPYFGKNEFQVWWGNFLETRCEPFDAESDFKVASLFRKGGQIIKKAKKQEATGLQAFAKKAELSFTYFERLPIGFSEIFQYEYDEFTFTNIQFQKGTKIGDLYRITGAGEIVQFF